VGDDVPTKLAFGVFLSDLTRRAKLRRLRPVRLVGGAAVPPVIVCIAMTPVRAPSPLLR